MENLDKDYIKYLRDSGKGEEAIFMYLEHLCQMMYEIREAMGMDMDEDKDLMGMFKIQPQSGGGLHKGPPPIIV